MTEYELAEISLALWGNVISIFAIFITTLSGYLIISYVSGKAMAASQVLIINILYIGLSVTLLLGMLSFITAATEFDKIAFEMTTQREDSPRPYLAYILIAIVGLCHLASLKFMWDVRREGDH